MGGGEGGRGSGREMLRDSTVLPKNLGAGSLVSESGVRPAGRESTHGDNLRKHGWCCSLKWGMLEEDVFGGEMKPVGPMECEGLWNTDVPD